MVSVGWSWRIHFQQCKNTTGSLEGSFEFDIAAGVRQESFLSPRLLFPPLKSIIQMAGGVGYDFQAGGVASLDVRYSLLSRIVRGCR